MSRIRTNLITNRMANGAPTVSHGLVVAGVTTITGSINNLNLTGITTISTLDLNGDLDVDGHLNADNVSIAGVVTATSFAGDGSNLTGLSGVSVANQADNRLITATGTTDALNAESTLTYGSGLDVGGSGGITISASGADLTMNSAGAIFTGNGGNETNPIVANVSDTNTGIFYPGGDHIAVTTGGSEALRIDSNGNLYIGATGPGNASVYARNLFISGSSNRGITIHTTDTSGSNRKCCLFFGTGTSVADMADGMLFYDHNGQYMHLSVNGAGTGVTKASLRLHSDGTVRFDSTPTTTNSISLQIKSHKARAVNDNNGILFKDASDHSQAAIYVQKKSTSDGSSDLVFSTSSGQVVATLQGIPERFRIDKDGKLYKGGNQIYPLVNYTEVTTFGNAAVSSSSYTDLRTILSGYTPKKAGNRIVIHHQSQMWNGAAANANGDVYWKIQRQEGGGSWTDTVKNERILGNHDGHSYTGGSGLARHHRTVHLMGSFICAGTSINLKTQGRSIGISWDWYHDGNNVLQIWEYEIN